jgi:transcriptional regulator with XRE-family HTH domain
MIFGYTLSSLRHQKGKRQKTLAYGLGMDPSQLSRIENGRKRPPRSDAFVEKLALLLELSDSEKCLLSSCARADRQLGEFAVGASSEQIRLAMLFAGKLKELTPKQITAIGAILDIEPNHRHRLSAGGHHDLVT